MKKSSEEITRPQPTSQEQRVKGVFVADHLGVVRCPLFPIGRFQEVLQCDRLQLTALVKKALQDGRFQEALFVASEDLYRRSVDWKDGVRDFKDIDVAVAKYLIRMSARPTPFGLFSSVGMVSVGEHETRVRAPEAFEVRKSVSMDYSALVWLAGTKVRDSRLNRLRYTTNDTIAIFEDYISYLAKARSGGGHILHNIQLERSDVLDFVVSLASAQGGITLAEAINGVCTKFGDQFGPDEIIEFVHELAKQEVLTSDALVSPTSVDPLGVLIEATTDQSPERVLLSELKAQLEKLSNTAVGESAQSVQQMTSVANGIRRADRAGQGSIKADAVVKDSLGSLSVQDARRIEDVANEIVEFLPRNGRLKVFKERFLELYGDASVGLADILPLLDGLGYPDQVGAEAALADRIRLAGQKPDVVDASPLNTLEMHAISLIAQNQVRDYVDLSAFQFAVDSTNRARRVPECLVAWVALWAHPTQGHILELKSLGVQLPGRVMGRFAHAIPALRSYLQNDERAELGQLVAQIVHVPVVGAGNIIARCRMPGPEIKIRAGGQAAGGDILLADLEVRVSNDRVFLWSRSRQVDIIPRMNSAHAFERSKGQAIYMFLNHVGNQDLICKTPSLRAKVANATYLPGLKYKSVLLERPSWRITLDEVGRAGQSSKSMLKAMRHWAEKVGLPSVFEECGRDKSIPYSLGQDWLGVEFLRRLRKQGTMVLTEVLPAELTPAVSAADGPRVHEIQFALRSGTGRTRSQKGRPHPFVRTASKTWLSWSVYCKPAVQNSVVCSLALASRQLDPKFQGNMFFIRYHDYGGEHIRVRFRIDDDADRLVLFSAIEKEFDRLVCCGLVYRFALKDYVPEVARYGGSDLLERAERVFCYDSALIIRTHGKLSGALIEGWRSAAIGADTLLKAIGVQTLKERKEFASRAAADFQKEMGFDLSQRKLIGRVFKDSAPIFNLEGGYSVDILGLDEFVETDEIGGWYDWSLGGFGNLDRDSVYRYRWSLLHMRFNRLFSRHPRVQEAACWELLKRSYLRAEKLVQGDLLGTRH